MSSIKLTVSAASVAHVVNRLQQKSQAIQAAAQVGIDVEASRIFQKAQVRAPRVTGALAESGGISARNTDTFFKRTIGYGTSKTNPQTGQLTAEYAVSRHETYNTAKPEAYKWLEMTIHEVGQERFSSTMADILRRALHS